jgi:hypothetical protein
MAKKTTKTKHIAKFPSQCPHKNFFGCKTPKDCPTCFYNPEIKYKELWFYDDPVNVVETLERLEDIRLGRGLRPGGRRFPWKYSRKKTDEEDI